MQVFVRFNTEEIKVPKDVVAYVDHFYSHFVVCRSHRSVFVNLLVCV